MGKGKGMNQLNTGLLSQMFSINRVKYMSGTVGGDQYP
jgi:hypothetical protein